MARFHATPTGDVPFSPEEEEEWDASDAEANSFINLALKQKAENRGKCNAHILTNYPLEVQSSASLGVYPAEFVTTMAQFIADCIAEENRVFDLIDSTTTVSELKAVETPTYPEA